MIKVVPKPSQTKNVYQALQNIQKLVSNLERQMEQIVDNVQQEKQNLEEFSEYLDEKGVQHGNVDYQNNSQDFTEFVSFYMENSIIQNNLVSNNLTVPKIEQIACLSDQKYDEKIANLLQIFKEKSPVKHRLLTENKSFLNNKIETILNRAILPAKRDPSEKMDLWKILKALIGKDLTKVSLPVFLNEPISTLQKLCEQFQYTDLLDKANHEQDSRMRMAYVIAYASFAVNSTTLNRLKKPFNPLLGETYELIDHQRKFKAIAEQVSHHPPISSVHCESDNFIFWGSADVKTQFWGKSVEIIPQGYSHVELKKNKDHISFDKTKTILQNILIGEMYVDHFGEQNLVNHTTGDTALISLKLRGWGNSNAYCGEGVIKDKNGKETHKIQGKWNEYCSVTDIATGKETILWKLPPLPQGNEWYYNLHEFQINLNLLNFDLLQQIAPTDSRLRPDQRALEYGDEELAGEEKERLEVKQRTRRKENEKINKPHEILWFQETFDKQTNNKEYIYKGGYWEARENQGQGFIDKCLDIY